MLDFPFGLIFFFFFLFYGAVKAILLHSSEENLGSMLWHLVTSVECRSSWKARRMNVGSFDDGWSLLKIHWQSP